MASRPLERGVRYTLRLSGAGSAPVVLGSGSSSTDAGATLAVTPCARSQLEPLDDVARHQRLHALRAGLAWLDRYLHSRSFPTR